MLRVLIQKTTSFSDTPEYSTVQGLVLFQEGKAERGAANHVGVILDQQLAPVETVHVFDLPKDSTTLEILWEVLDMALEGRSVKKAEKVEAAVAKPVTQIDIATDGKGKASWNPRGPTSFSKFFVQLMAKRGDTMTDAAQRAKVPYQTVVGLKAGKGIRLDTFFDLMAGYGLRLTEK